MDYQLLAAQLRKPAGEFGKEVGEQMNVSNKYINQRTIQLLGIGEHDKVLEIGMGNGFFCGEVLACHPSVTYAGCDYSELMVSEATGLNRQWVDAGRAAFYMAEASSLPFADASFDKVFTVNTIYFWKSPRQELTELYRVLKPGGQLMVSIRPESDMKNLPIAPYGFTLFEGAGLKELLTKAGFSGIELLQEKEPEIKTKDFVYQFHAVYARGLR